MLFAIVFGAIFGLVIAFGVWRLNSSLSTKSQDNNTSSSPQPSTSPDTFGLTIAKPNELSVFIQSSTKIEGLSKANSWIVSSGEEDDNIIQTKSDGSFEVNADLIGGLNQIIITSFDETGASSQKSLLLVYSSSFPQPQEGAPERLKEAQNPAIAYIGTITDITESTINLKNSSEEIGQVSVSDETVYANEVSKKEIKFKDLAIGDFIVAMGYKNGNQVLKAKRLVVSSPIKSPNRQFHFGKVVQIKNKILTLSKTDGSVDLTFPRKWKGPDVDEIKEESQAIVVTNSEGKNSIRTIQIIK